MINNNSEHSDIKVWQFIADKNAAGIKTALLYVLHSEGSSPGRQGFKMSVAADGNFCGSIGGGMMEHKFVEMAKAILAEENDQSTLFKQVHKKDAAKNQSGMICSGEQTIFLHIIQSEEISQVNEILLSLKRNRNGSLSISTGGIKFSEAIPISNFFFEQKSDTDFLLVEKTGYKNILHIVGGGHCALSLSRLISRMDFYIHVYEDRNELNTMEQNLYAHEQHFVDSYNELSSQIDEGDHVFIMIMTFGYRTDDMALKAVWNKKVKYLGMLGSKAKVEKMFTDYSREKIMHGLRERIYAPAGMPIRSQTPDEIAVSIAAEIIFVKNNIQ